MTMKAKRNLAIGGGTALCAALAVLIATRFAPDDRQLTTSTPSNESKPTVSVDISTAKREETKPIESTAVAPDNTPAEINPEKEAVNFIEGGGIEIEQNFPEPEKDNEPPAPPQIENEAMLTNPDKEPTYEPEQIEVKPQTKVPSNTPKHGEKMDGMIYINGFGWVADEGGGGVGYTDTEMYENGNKIGYFG